MLNSQFRIPIEKAARASAARRRIRIRNWELSINQIPLTHYAEVLRSTSVRSDQCLILSSEFLSEKTARASAARRRIKIRNWELSINQIPMTDLRRSFQDRLHLDLTNLNSQFRIPIRKNRSCLCGSP